MNEWPPQKKNLTWKISSYCKFSLQQCFVTIVLDFLKKGDIFGEFCYIFIGICCRYEDYKKWWIFFSKPQISLNILMILFFKKQASAADYSRNFFLGCLNAKNLLIINYNYSNNNNNNNFFVKKTLIHTSLFNCEIFTGECYQFKPVRHDSVYRLGSALGSTVWYGSAHT